MIPSNLLSLPFSLPPPSTNPIPNYCDRNPCPIPSTNCSCASPPIRARRFRCPCWRSSSSWDSNAESVGTGRFRFRDEEEVEEDGDSRSSSSRRWWSGDSPDELDDEFDPFEDDTEQLWDRIWIFKVLKSYGYLLPAIIASMLLATGPKAFLMALALPLGQSAISLAIEKVWGRARDERRAEPKTKRKPFSRSSSDFRKQGQEERSSSYKGRNGYQSWVSGDAGVSNRVNGSSKSSFGGWDELDNQKCSTKTKAPRSTQREPVKRGKLSKRERYRDVPLFLRLLIAVFPFLGSWTRLL